MTIYKQILESAKPAGEFGKDEQVVELNFVLGLVDTEEAQKEIPVLEPINWDRIRCSTCKHYLKYFSEQPCSTCTNGYTNWEPKEMEEK